MDNKQFQQPGVAVNWPDIPESKTDFNHGQYHRGRQAELQQMMFVEFFLESRHGDEGANRAQSGDGEPS